MKTGFSVQAVLTRVGSTVDGGLSLGLHTKELTAEEKVSAMGFHNQTGWMVFSPNAIDDSDIPTTLAETGQKTYSQRLRAVLFVLFTQLGEPGDFEQFYRNKMESLINEVKAKLQP